MTDKLKYYQELQRIIRDAITTINAIENDDEDDLLTGIVLERLDNTEIYIKWEINRVA